MNLCLLDRDGWPVVAIIGRKWTNLLRAIIHTRRIVRGYWDGYKVVKP